MRPVDCSVVVVVLLQPHSPVKSPVMGEEFMLPVHPHKKRPSRVMECQLTLAPILVQALIPKVGQWH